MEEYSIVYLMGHQQRAGVVYTPDAESPLVALWTPEVEAEQIRRSNHNDKDYVVTVRQPKMLLHFGPQAIFEIRPCSKERAIEVTKANLDDDLCVELLRRPATKAERELPF